MKKNSIVHQFVEDFYLITTRDDLYDQAIMNPTRISLYSKAIPASQAIIAKSDQLLTPPAKDRLTPTPSMVLMFDCRSSFTIPFQSSHKLPKPKPLAFLFPNEKTPSLLPHSSKIRPNLLGISGLPIAIFPSLLILLSSASTRPRRRTRTCRRSVIRSPIAPHKARR